MNLSLVFVTIAAVAVLSNGLLLPGKPGKGCRPCSFNPCIATTCLTGSKCIPNFCKCRGRCVAPPCNQRRVCRKAKCGFKRRCIVDKKTCTAKCQCVNRCPLLRCRSGYVCEHDSRRCTSRCVPKCQRPCPKILRPVCGTDGVTYDNQCLLEIAICKSGGKIQKKKDGRCECKNKCPVTKCAKGFVCDFNPLQCTRCIKCQDRCPATLCIVGSICKFDPVKCTSTCVPVSPPKCDFACIALFDPVCGTDGRTYSNECELSRATCSSGGAIQKRSDGECPPVYPPCPPPPSPPPGSEPVLCGQAITTFCTDDCKTCCINPNTCKPGGPIDYSKTKFQCDAENE